MRSMQALGTGVLVLALAFAIPAVAQNKAAFVSYLAGKRDLERVIKLEAKLPTLEGKKRARAEEDIEKAYADGIAALREALRMNPKHVDASALLGGALLRTGRPEEALRVHADAVRQAPDDEASLVGWVRALLALNRVGDAVQAYDRIVEDKPELARLLIAEMKGWRDARRAEPGELPPEAIDRMDSWLAEREGSGQ